MRQLIFVLLASALSISLSAQTFVPGTIVKQNGETVKGFIQDGTDAELAFGITFKKTESEAGEKFSPETISGFSFDYGRHFKRYSIPNPQSKGDSMAVFVKRVVEGKIDLYTARKGTETRPDMVLKNNSSQRVVFLTQPKKITTTDQAGHVRSGESYQHVGLITSIKDTPSTNSKKLRYSEKAIRKDIVAYNESYQKEFPLRVYQPKTVNFYDIAVGMPISSPDYETVFRVSVYRNKYNVEKSRTLSFVRGVSYRYAGSSAAIDPSEKDNQDVFRQQFVSLIPFGVNFQGKGKVVKPYAYIGCGLMFAVESLHHIENFENKGDESEFYGSPTLSLGVGAKVKVGSNFLLAEVTPAFEGGAGLFFNVGYSF